MFRTVFAFVLAITALAAPASAQAPLDRARVAAYVDGAVEEAIRVNHIGGVSVAIVDRSGVVMTRGYGVAALSPRRGADADTLFRVGSISKTGVWISLMQLAQAGKISLDDPINAHLPPDLQIADQGFKAPIRIRDLMNHSAGFEDSVLEGFIIHDQNRLVSLDAFLRGHRLHRVREPGQVSVYSNYGAILGAAIVAHTSGQLWEDYAEQHVFRPLGMADATYRQPYPAAFAARRGLPAPMPTQTLARLADSFLYANGEFESKGFEYVNGGEPVGAMSVSANEMAHYMAALLDPAQMQKSGVLNADTAMAMLTGIPVKDPQLAVWRHGFMDLNPTLGRPAFGHDGDLIYQHATMIIDPQDGLAIFIAVNTPSGARLLSALPINFLNTFAGPAPPAPARIADAKNESAKVVGQYEGLRRPMFRSERAFMGLLAGGEVTATKDGDILVNNERFYPIGHGVFAHAGGPQRIAFAEVDGHMRQYDSFGANPADRVSFMASGEWLQLIIFGGVFVATWGGLAFWIKLGRKDEPGRRAGLLLDGLCLWWVGAFALFYVALAPSLSDLNAMVFTWPGKVWPLALWALALASAATPVAAVVAFGPWRPRDWSWWRWGKQGLALAILLSLAGTLLAWGFLGFSGWN